MILAELKLLQNDGFGHCVLKKDVKGVQKDFFAKPHPNSLREDDRHLKVIMMTLDAYRARFNEVGAVSTASICSNPVAEWEISLNVILLTYFVHF